MIPICIQTIENDDDRDFMEWLFLEYHPLMYATIRKVIHDQWTCEDVLQESVRKFIDHIPQLREMDAASRTNYIVVACRHNAIEEEKRCGDCLCLGRQAQQCADAADKGQEQGA